MSGCIFESMYIKIGLHLASVCQCMLHDDMLQCITVVLPIVLRVLPERTDWPLLDTKSSWLQLLSYGTVYTSGTAELL